MVLLTGQQTKDSVSAVTFTSHVSTNYSQQWSHTEYLGIKLKPNFAITDFQDCTCSVQQSKRRDLWQDDCPSTCLKRTQKVMVILRTTSLHVLPMKGLLKIKVIRKSLQSLKREKGNHRSQVLSQTGQTESFFFSTSHFLSQKGICRTSSGRDHVLHPFLP